MAIKLLTNIGVRYDLPLLPHWIEHYTALGVRPRDFIVILNDESHSNHMTEAERLLRQAGVRRVIPWVGQFTSRRAKRLWHSALGCYAQDHDWVVHAEADDFHVYPDNLYNVLTDDARYNAIQAPYIDRLAESGKLEPVRPPGCAHGSIHEQYPCRFDVMIGLGGIRGGTVKLIAYRGYLRPSDGVHRVDAEDANKAVYHAGRELEDPSVNILNLAVRVAMPFRVEHFKWHEGALAKLKQRVRTYRSLGYDWWRQSQRVLKHYQDHGDLSSCFARPYPDIAPQERLTHG